MDASHKTHRPHIKVGKDEEKKKEEDGSLKIDMLWLLIIDNVHHCHDSHRNQNIHSINITVLLTLPDWIIIG